MKNPLRIIIAICIGLFALILILIISFVPSHRQRVLAKTELSDGRILQIEGVSFGTNHHIGDTSPIVEHFGPWLPPIVRQYLHPKFPRSEITLDDPGLVVWVDAIDPKTGSNVDCQGIRVEFVSQNGDLFGQETSSWSGFDNHYWRVGHIFKAFPRDEPKLTLQITPWRAKSNQHPSRVEFANPFVTAPAKWTGAPLPQKQKIGGTEIVLASLELRTNGGPKRYWESPATYWKPNWEMRRDGVPAVGWDDPEWIAEDPLGNRGQQLGVHQPVLRFTATYYPMATNSYVVSVIATLPPVAPNQLSNEVVWNTNCDFETNRILAIGCFPAGMYLFSEGAYVSNPPPSVRMGPTRGGAPSGWVGTAQRISPVKLARWSGHYTPSPVIYLKLPDSASTARFAMRARDEQGKYWILTPESQGAAQGIMPYLIKLPPEVKTVTPEVVLLRPISATFSVDINAASQK